MGKSRVWLIFLLFCPEFGIPGISLIRYTQALVNIPLKYSQYSYLVDYEVDSVQYDGVIDTRSDLIIPMNPSSSSSPYSCISRLIDESLMNYSTNVYSCPSSSGFVQIAEFGSQVNVSYALQRYLANPNLHSWPSSTGVFGLNYPSDIFNPETAAQNLMLNGTNSTIFGLDFNDKDSVSSMQFGGISDIYKDGMIWSSIPAMIPTTDHTTFIHSFQFCDSISIMANWSKNWPIIVDTSSVCLTLPSEYYHIFLAWFNTTINTNLYTMHDLPYLSFTLSPDEDSEQLFISLLDLLVNSSDIIHEIVPHLITVPSISPDLSLCVLEGPTIYQPKKGDFAVPPIIFGSLTLRSLYFGANMKTYQIGFANKYKSINPSSSLAQCQEPATCVGQYHLHRTHNVCVKPECSRYYYVTFNPSTGICEYNHGAYVVGILFLTVITCLEVFTFFTSQYTFLEHSYYTSMRFKPDFITQYLGSYLISLFEFLRISVLGWSSEEGTVSGTEPGILGAEEDVEDEVIQEYSQSTANRRRSSSDGISDGSL